MIEIARFPIQEEMLCYVESLYFLKNGSQVLCCNLSRDEFVGELDSALRNEILKSHEDNVLAFNMAYNELLRMLLPIEYLQQEYCHYLNFLTGELIVQKLEEPS